MDVINCDNFFGNQLRGLDRGPKFAISHWLSRSPLTQCWRYRAARDNANRIRAIDKLTYLLTYVGLLAVIVFTARRSYASAVLEVVVSPVSVRPSGTCVLCGKIKQCTADILIPHERAITLVDTNSGCWATPSSMWNLRSKWPTHPPSKMPTLIDFRL